MLSFLTSLPPKLMTSLSTKTSKYFQILMPQKVSKTEQNHKILVSYGGQNLYSAVTGLLEKFHVEHKLVSFSAPSYIHTFPMYHATYKVLLTHYLNTHSQRSQV